MGVGNRAMALGRERELMWEYKKRLEYPVKIKNPNPALAKVIISQLGGTNCICYNSPPLLQGRLFLFYKSVFG